MEFRVPLSDGVTYQNAVLRKATQLERLLTENAYKTKRANGEIHEDTLRDSLLDRLDDGVRRALAFSMSAGRRLRRTGVFAERLPEGRTVGKATCVSWGEGVYILLSLIVLHVHIDDR